MDKFDGGGSILKKDFTKRVREHVDKRGKPFEKCLEWCDSIDDYEQALRQEYEHYFTQTKKGIEKCNEYCMTWDEILEETRALITLGVSDEKTHRK